MTDQPGLIEAAREVCAAWKQGGPFCEPGSTLDRLHDALTALPPTPVIVDRFLLTKAAIFIEADAKRSPLIADTLTEIARQLRAAAGETKP